jgi:low temperature requirement protein LtrA
MATAWLAPPRLRTVEDDELERRATWLELFFDLVFVVAVAQVGQELAKHPTALGFVHFAALFVPIWWAWMGFTFYADRFDTDDLVYRVWTLAGMLAVAAFAVNIRAAFGSGWTAFVGSYVAVRVVLLVLYGRAYRFVPQARGLSTVYLVAFGAGVVLWIASALVAAPARYGVWGAALAIELAAPLLGWRAIRHAPVHASHIPERFGLFTIIVLGEAVLAVVVGTAGTSWGIEPSVVAACCFVVAAGVWWLQFDFVDTSVLKRGLFGLVYVYAHYPLVLGIAAFGVGTKLAIHDAASDHLAPGARWALGGGLGVALLSLAVLELATVRSARDADLWLRLGASLACFALAAVGAVVPEVAVVGALAAVLVALVAAEIGGHARHHPA